MTPIFLHPFSTSFIADLRSSSVPYTWTMPSPSLADSSSRMLTKVCSSPSPVTTALALSNVPEVHPVRYQ